MSILGLVLLIVLLAFVFRIDRESPVYPSRDVLLILLVVIVVLYLVSGFGYWPWGPRF